MEHGETANFCRMVKCVAIPEPEDNIIPLESVLNLRQVDGCGHLFRSARQDRATPVDVQQLRETLGVRTFIDLRSQREYRDTMQSKPKALDGEVRVVVPEIPNPKRAPYPPTDAIQLKDLRGRSVSIATPETPRRYLISMCPIRLFYQIYRLGSLTKMLLSCLLLLLDVVMGTGYRNFVRSYADVVNKMGVARLYADVLDHQRKEICFILKTLSDPANLPALLNCAHGKDRTGIVTALILSILGRSDDYIAEDYALSEECLKPILPSMFRRIVSKYNLDSSFALSNKENMLQTLAILRDRYGSVDNYLESIGFGAKDQEKLRQVLS